MTITNWVPAMIDLARGHEVRDGRGEPIGALRFDGKDWKIDGDNGLGRHVAGLDVWQMCWLLNMIGATAEVQG
jgi:hypothetical protein